MNLNILVINTTIKYSLQYNYKICQYSLAGEVIIKYFECQFSC